MHWQVAHFGMSDNMSGHPRFPQQTWKKRPCDRCVCDHQVELLVLQSSMKDIVDQINIEKSLVNAQPVASRDTLEATGFVRPNNF